MKGKIIDCFITCLLLIIFSMLMSSCSRLYWYRQKVKIDSEIKTPIHFKLINHSSAYLSPSFEKSIQAYCLKALNKKGFIETHKDTPVYDFVIHLKIDSFSVRYHKWLDPIYDGMSYGNVIREISFEYDLFYANTGIHYWVNHSNFYYFSRNSRDLKRSRSMINYVIKNAPKN